MPLVRIATMLFLHVNAGVTQSIMGLVHILIVHGHFVIRVGGQLTRFNRL